MSCVCGFWMRALGKRGNIETISAGVLARTVGRFVGDSKEGRSSTVGGLWGLEWGLDRTRSVKVDKSKKVVNKADCRRESRLQELLLQ